MACHSGSWSRVLIENVNVTNQRASSIVLSQLENSGSQSMMPTLRVGVVCELEVDAALAPVHLQVGRVQHLRDPGGARREHPRRAPH